MARIADTYGLSGNAIEEASIGITSANLTTDNTLVSLGQSLENARVAYEKAQKDYESSRLSSDGSGTVSRAELDLQNYITTQEKTLSGYETTYLSQLQSFQSFIVNVIDTSDTLLGVSQEKSNLNDSYDYLLSASDSQKKNDAIQSLANLMEYKNWKPDAKLSLIERVLELQRVYILVSKVLTDVKAVLIHSVTDSVNFTPANLATQKATIDGYQTQYSTISG